MPILYSYTTTILDLVFLVNFRNLSTLSNYTRISWLSHVLWKSVSFDLSLCYMWHYVYLLFFTSGHCACISWTFTFLPKCLCVPLLIWLSLWPLVYIIIYSVIVSFSYLSQCVCIWHLCLSNWMYISVICDGLPRLHFLKFTLLYATSILPHCLE